MEPDMPGVKDDMYQMASQILSDWAMMMVEPSPSGTQIFEADQNFLISELQFRGLVSGRWIVVCQSSFVETLMNNLLGEPGSDVEVEGKDALRELVNVLSGNLLTAAYGVDTSFELHSPTCKETNFDEAEQIISKSTVVSFRADDFPVSICFLPEGV